MRMRKVFKKEYHFKVSSTFGAEQEFFGLKNIVAVELNFSRTCLEPNLGAGPCPEWTSCFGDLISTLRVICGVKLTSFNNPISFSYKEETWKKKYQVFCG